jgi:hypothetical protein
VIKLLLESRIINSSDLKRIYFELNKKRYFNKKKDPFLLYLQKSMKNSKDVDSDLFDNHINKIKFKHFQKLEEDLFPKSESVKIFDRNLFNETKLEEQNKENRTELEEFNENNIFYWCILTNRIECAKVLWIFGKAN